MAWIRIPNPDSPPRTVVGRFFYDSSPSIAAFAIFLFSLLGQVLSGASTCNQDNLEHGRLAVPLRAQSGAQAPRFEPRIQSALDYTSPRRGCRICESVWSKIRPDLQLRVADAPDLGALGHITERVIVAVRVRRDRRTIQRQGLASRTARRV